MATQKNERYKAEHRPWALSKTFFYMSGFVKMTWLTSSGDGKILDTRRAYSVYRSEMGDAGVRNRGKRRAGGATWVVLLEKPDADAPLALLLPEHRFASYTPTSTRCVTLRSCFLFVRSRTSNNAEWHLRNRYLCIGYPCCSCC